MHPVSVDYGPGHRMDGIMYFDTVTVGPGLTVVDQPIGVADHVQGFDGFDGILGIGPTTLTLTTLTQTPTTTIPTVTDNLVDQKVIRANILGVFFKPYVGSQEETAGQLTFGGTDNTLIISNIIYTPITNVWPASQYWGIDQSITYGTRDIIMILPQSAGIVDSGNTFIFIATEAFERYQVATGGQYDPATGLLVITGDQYNALENLNFNIGGRIFTLTPNAQIWPRALNYILGAQRDFIYLIVRNKGTRLHQGPFDFTIGYVFMQRFYTVFDASNSRVGFSATEFTAATTN